MRRSHFILYVAIFLTHGSLNADQTIFDSWRMTLKKPSKGWEQPQFDDTAWKKASGGFGTRSTPGSRVGTEWRTSDIWLRKKFELKKVPPQPAFLIHHDEDVEVYLNGKKVLSLKEWTTKYTVIPFSDEAKKQLQQGSNLLSVHCHQRFGGQFIDVHVIDATKVPKLPRPKRDPKPFQSELITKWGAQVTAENAWTEYPRPQLVRESWENLNGKWNYAITKSSQRKFPSKWQGQILVPYCLESKLGGVQRYLEPDEALWYRKQNIAPLVFGNQRALLNFEAVEYKCEIYINRKLVGKHIGGSTPFTIDITSALTRGTNELIVRVEDDTEAYQLRGKQVLYPRGIWYTQVSGIWQTVWLEVVSSNYIRDFKVETKIRSGEVTIRPQVEGEVNKGTLKIRIRDGADIVAELEGPIGKHTITLKDPKLWSPQSPHLYDLELILSDSTGSKLDQVRSYFGMREIGKIRDQDGHFRFTLNGKEIYHLGPLDQGWWPDGLLTPPSDEGMLYDIQVLKDAGFNMIRKHIKVEPRRYYAHCDRLGMMVWQDQVSAGNNPPWTRLKSNPKDAIWPEEQHQQFLSELDRMVSALENHPSIVVWVPFNEAWGQHKTMEIGKWMVKRDPTRQVNIASGGNFWPIGDIVDHHNYPHPNFPFQPERFKNFIKVIGEFGGHGYPVKGHLWDSSRRNWGYGGLPKNLAEFKERYLKSMELMVGFKKKGIAGGVYTQTTDVEGEINGLMTYDRKVIKINPAELKKIHEKLIQN